MQDVTRTESLGFSELASLLSDAERALASHRSTLVTPAALESYARALAHAPPGYPYNRVTPEARAFRDQLAAEGGPPLVGAVHRLLLVRGIVRSREHLESEERLREVRPWFESAAAQIARDVPTIPDEKLDFSIDRFLKDMAAVWLRIWPCGAQVVEPRLGISRRFLVQGGPSTLVRGLMTLARLGGHAPLYEIHTYDRSLSEFTPQGWEACYLRIARLMASDPPARGLFGASWFFDPALRTVSPRLAYLRDFPISNGAVFVRVRATAATFDNALSKSETRRRLYEEGKYVPTQHLMIWGRRELLRWAAALDNGRGGGNH